MDASPQEQAKSHIVAALQKKGYRGKLPFEFSVAKKEFDDDYNTSVLIPLPPSCGSGIVPFLARQLEILKGHSHSSLTSFHNGDGGLSIWHDSSNPRLEIARKGELSEKDIGLVAELYHACNDFAAQKKKEKDDDELTAKQESKLLTIEQKLTAAGAVVYQSANLDFSALSGYQPLKQEIQETIILRMKYPDIYETVTKATRRREETPTAQTVLFEGPPGTGKTTMGRIIASQANCPFVYLPFEQVRSKYYGESEKNFGEVFDLCAKYPQAILFLDEIDTFASSRSGNSDNEVSARMLGVLLRKMDGFKENRNVLVIGTTNRPEDLDGALKSRFKRRVYFPLPNCVERAWIFESYAKHLELEQVAKLAQITDGFSGRDILNACQATEESWARNMIEGKEKEPIPSFDTYKATLEKRVEKKKDRFGF